MTPHRAAQKMASLLVRPTDRLKPTAPSALQEIAPNLLELGVTEQHADRPLEPVDLLDVRRPVRDCEFPQLVSH